MPNSIARTERERPAKASGSVRRSSEETIARAAARSLRPLVDDAERSLAKVGEGKATEKRVHNLRGTLRKAEILLGTLGCGFDPAVAARLTKGVRRLRKAGGEVRDMDVAMEVVRAVSAGGDDASRRAGEEVIGILAARRARALKRFVPLCAKHGGTLRVGLKEMLRARVRGRARLRAGCAAAIALAREGEAMQEAVRTGLVTPGPLHELRLSLKEVRTILEAMGPVMGAGAGGLAERARRLADALGRVNDLVTLGELLGELLVKGRRATHGSVNEVARLVRSAHAAQHKAAARRATREVPRLVREIRALAFGGE